MDETYSIWTGLVYVFNLIVGTGALTLPNSFSQAGWLVGVILLTLLAIFSYVTATFVVEAMAISNAVNQFKRVKQLKRVSQTLCTVIQAVDTDDDVANNDENNDDTEDDLDTSEDTPLFGAEYIQNFPSNPTVFYSIDEKVEMGQMATLLFPRVGQILFFFCFCLYLFGDLAIYSATVSDSLVDVFCVDNKNSSDSNSDLPCWFSSRVTESQAYKLFLCAFLAIFGPFVFFNVQKTKYLQIITSITRWLAFTVMITLAVRRLFSPSEQHGSPVPARLSGIPALFGSCIYSFMCHHSLPGLLTPIRSKSKLDTALAADYFLVLFFYLILALTGVFAFPVLNELYTLNFTPKPDDPFYMRAIDYFLTLFPVFTLSTNFPVVAVTLRSNLQSMFSLQHSPLIRNVIIPLFAVSSPVFLAMVVQDVETLVRYTGSYAGTGIQYLIPAFLVMTARSSIPQEIRLVNNEYASPFSSNIWPIFIIIWSFICCMFVTVDIANSFL